jgi:2-polyprenyl-3-methyl-5-hydroxy-6-metoxy-1,4-benzoquinol methylase
VFVPPQYLPDLDEERAEYDKHENHPGDAGYRQFLSRFMHPLIERVPIGATGLDFGCGPGPVLASMLRECGHKVDLYDPIYFPDTAVFDHHYEFVCATEVVEHMHRPGIDLERIWNLLVGGGWLGVMTKLVRGPEAFSSWHYIRDPTHVCFFSRNTWSWWATRHEAELKFIGDDVILLQRGTQP